MRVCVFFFRPECVCVSYPVWVGDSGDSAALSDELKHVLSAGSEATALIAAAAQAHSAPYRVLQHQIGRAHV